jgi:hypothetical protein
VPPQLAHDRLGALQFAELVEHEPQPRLHLLVRVERDPAAAFLDQPGRQRHRSSPRAAFCRSPWCRRMRIWCSSASLMMPDKPSRRRSW